MLQLSELMEHVCSQSSHVHVLIKIILIIIVTASNDNDLKNKNESKKVWIPIKLKSNNYSCYHTLKDYHSKATTKDTSSRKFTAFIMCADDVGVEVPVVVGMGAPVLVLVVVGVEMEGIMGLSLDF